MLIFVPQAVQLAIPQILECCFYSEEKKQQQYTETKRICIFQNEALFSEIRLKSINFTGFVNYFFNNFWDLGSSWAIPRNLQLSKE